MATPGAPVGAVSRSAGKLDIFVVGQDGGVYAATWEPSFTDGWRGWSKIGEIQLPPGGSVTAISRSLDKLDIFAVDVQGRIMTAAWQPAFADVWSGWWHINGGLAAPGTPVGAVSRGPDKLDIFVPGQNGRVYSATWEPSFTDGWHGWLEIGDIEPPVGGFVTAVSRSPDKLDIFAVDVNGRTVSAAWEPAFTDGWHGWWHINGGIAQPGAFVGAVSRGPDKLDIFVVGQDGQVYSAAWEPAFADGWHGWWRIGDIRLPDGGMDPNAKVRVQVKIATIKAIDTEDLGGDEFYLVSTLTDGTPDHTQAAVIGPFHLENKQSKHPNENIFEMSIPASAAISGAIAAFDEDAAKDWSKKPEWIQYLKDFVVNALKTTAHPKAQLAGQIINWVYIGVDFLMKHDKDDKLGSFEFNAPASGEAYEKRIWKFSRSATWWWSDWKYQIEIEILRK